MHWEGIYIFPSVLFYVSVILHYLEKCCIFLFFYNICWLKFLNLSLNITEELRSYRDLLQAMSFKPSSVFNSRLHFKNSILLMCYAMMYDRIKLLCGIIFTLCYLIYWFSQVVVRYYFCRSIYSSSIKYSLFYLR